MKTHLSIDYAEAKRMVDTIAARLLADGKAAVIAVADPHGELLAFARLDEAPLSSITIAINNRMRAGPSVSGT